MRHASMFVFLPSPKVRVTTVTHIRELNRVSTLKGSSQRVGAYQRISRSNALKLKQAYD